MSQRALRDGDLRARELHVVPHLSLVNRREQRAGGTRQEQSGCPRAHGTGGLGGWNRIARSHANRNTKAIDTHQQVMGRTPDIIARSGACPIVTPQNFEFWNVTKIH
jgi:hypothetical protein